MKTSSERPEGRRVSLSNVREASLDGLSGADVSAIVQKVVSTHLDRTRITAAKFSSFI
jgi:hypothetical protein